MTDLDIMITLLSGAAHDMDHPGTNSVFEMKCKETEPENYRRLDLETAEMYFSD